jgi:hypothetical protein
MVEEKSDLETRFGEAIEQYDTASSYDNITSRVCGNESGNTGIEFKIIGEFVPIQPIVDVVSDSEFVIDEFAFATDVTVPALYVFVYAEMFGRDETWSSKHRNS